MSGKFFVVCLSLSIALGGGSARAERIAEIDIEPPAAADFKLRGFGTMGVAHSSSDQVEFVRDLSQPRGVADRWTSRIDSLLGVQANWRMTSGLELAGQAVSRYRYDKNRDPEILWAYAHWEPDPRVSIRAGRLGADFLMAADSRQVGYSYLPVRPSADYFGSLFFNYFDGADISATTPVNDGPLDGLLRAKFYAGRIGEKSSLADRIWDSSHSPLRGIVVDYFVGAWQWRASSAQIRFSHDMPFEPLPSFLRSTGVPTAAAAADAIAVGGTRSRFVTLGAIYDEGPLQLQGMVNDIRHESATFQNSHAGYLLAAYRFGATTPYLGMSWWKSHSKEVATGLPPIPALATILRDSGVDQTTYTLGVRWDACANVALKAQWDAIRGDASSVFPYRGDKPGWDGRANLLSFTVDFTF